MGDSLNQVLLVVLALMGASIAVAVIGLLMLARQIRQLRIPHEADFFTTMRLVPLALVILLDLLDFGLDIFATPVVWIVLDRMGLPALRNKAAIEALIPFSGPIPTFTLCWLAARMLNLGAPEMAFMERFSRQRVGGLRGEPRRRATIIDMDDER